MDTMEKYYYFMDSITGVGFQSVQQLMQVFDTPREAYLATQEQLTRILGEKRARQWCNLREKMDLEQEYRDLQKKSINFYSYYSPDYPQKLKEISDPPLALYVKGSLPKRDSACMAVVGARRCSSYGREVARQIGTAFGMAGIPVVSGMAVGIDGIAQESALLAGGSSFGVLGCGVDICYPRQHESLYEKIQEKGGVLSSYKPGTMPKPELFPPRNRIISGLSDGVIVVEAGEKSGTLITVDMALEQGREIFCVPGRITDRLSSGCNRLIDLGAHMVLSVDQLLETLVGTCTLPMQKEKNLSPVDGIDKIDKSMTKREREVYKLLDIHPISGEQIFLQLSTESLYNWTFQEVVETLWQLICKGVAESVSTGLYMKKSSY